MRSLRASWLCVCLAVVALAAHAEEVKTISLQEAFSLDSHEDMYLLAVHKGDGCEEALSSVKRTIDEMQPVVDSLIVRLQDDAQVDQAADKYGSELEALSENGCQVQLVLLPFGTDKEDIDEYMVYDGPMDDGKALQTWVTDFMPDGFTPEVMPETWEVFMTTGAEQEGEVEEEEEEEADSEEEGWKIPMPPKVLLFTNKDHVPGVLKALSLRFRNVAKLGFGWCRAHDERNKPIVDQIAPSKVPHLVLLLPMPGGPESQGRVQISAQPFTGAMRYDRMHAWLSQMASMLESFMGGSSRPVEVPQVALDLDFQKHCVTRGRGVCVIGLLDAEKSGSQKLVKMMGKVAGKNREQPFYFSYVDAPRHRQFLEAFGVSTSDLPTAVAFSAARMRYAVLPESLDEPSDLTRFIDGVLGGRIRTLPLEALPSLEATSPGTQEPQAEAEEEPIVEEEFDLSDIMSEDVEQTTEDERRRKIEEELQEEQAKKGKSKNSKSEL